MENQTGLIKQDVLAVAMQEARRKKIAKWELEKRVRKNALNIELNNTTRELIELFLNIKFDINPEQIADILNDAHARLKIAHALLKYLKKMRTIFKILEIVCVSIIFLPLFVNILAGLPEYWLNYLLLVLFLFFTGTALASPIYFFLVRPCYGYSLIGKITKKYYLLNNFIQSTSITRFIKHIKELIIDLETNQKLIEGG